MIGQQERDNLTPAAALSRLANYAYLNRYWDALKMYAEGATFREVQLKHGGVVAREAELRKNR